MNLPSSFWLQKNTLCLRIESVLALLVILSILLTIASHAIAGTEGNDSLRRATFGGLEKPSLDIIIFAGNYPPFHTQEDGFIDGLGPSLVFEVFKRMGLQFTLRALPWNRAMETMREGEADAVLALSETSKRQAFLCYPKEYLFMESSSFFARKDSRLRYSGNLADFKELPISVVQGYSYGTTIDNADFLDLRPAINDKKMVQMVLYYRYPLGIGNRHVVSYYAAQDALASEIEFLEPVATNSPSYIAFSRKRHLENLAAAFSDELKAFKETDRYQEILTEFGVE